MRSTPLVATVTSLAMAFGGLALAQHQHSGAGAEHTQHVADHREPVRVPADRARHMLANMRDHLLALQEIQDALSRNETTQAAQIAERRLGMSSLSLHGAHDIARHIPQGMQEAGLGMHRAASRFAVEAQNAGASGELRPALAALGAVTAQCVACHAGYRLD